MSFTRSAGTPPPWYGVNPIQTNVSSNYAALATDYYIGVNGTNVTVTLPLGTSVVQGKTYVVKDESGLINASALYRVTVATSGADLVDGQTAFIIALNYGAVGVLWTGTKWSIF
jgi:Tfp pilus assembly protein PilX